MHVLVVAFVFNIITSLAAGKSAKPLLYNASPPHTHTHSHISSRMVGRGGATHRSSNRLHTTPLWFRWITYILHITTAKDPNTYIYNAIHARGRLHTAAALDRHTPQTLAEACGRSDQSNASRCEALNRCECT